MRADDASYLNPVSSPIGCLPSQNADKIIVLANGKKLEEGSHDALICRGGAYTHLLNLRRHAVPSDETSMHPRSATAYSKDESTCSRSDLAAGGIPSHFE
jgi:hypothetical protein